MDNETHVECCLLTELSFKHPLDIIKYTQKTSKLWYGDASKWVGVAEF